MRRVTAQVKLKRGQPRHKVEVSKTKGTASPRQIGVETERSQDPAGPEAAFFEEAPVDSDNKVCESGSSAEPSCGFKGNAEETRKDPSGCALKRKRKQAAR